MTATATDALHAAADRTEDAPVASSRQLLWRALGARRRDLVSASILYSTHQLGESMVPVIIGATISQAVDHGSASSIALWLAVLGADFAFLSLSYRFGARASMRAKQHAGNRARMWLTGRVVGPAGGVSHPPGDLLSRASSDATRVGAYAGILASTIAAVVVVIASTIMLLSFSLVLGLVIVVGTVMLLVAQNLVSRRLRRRSTVEQLQRAGATMLAEDLIRGLRVLKGIGAQRAAAARYRQASQSAVGASVDAVSSEAELSSVGSIFTGLYLVIIAGIGGSLALSGQLSLGQLVAALGLAQFVIGPMQAVSAASAAYARALASAERIREVLAATPAVSEPESAAAQAPEDAGTIEFVAAGLDPAHRGRFELTARLPAGAMTGIVCGEPAIAARISLLLAREQDLGSGEILLDGVGLPRLALDDLRTRMLVGYHDSPLLPGSIADNLAALATDAETGRRAAAAAFADQVVQTVPAGEATSVGDRGETLSGGQRQRIALARVLAASAPVLVLHDPTTAVDAATEDRIAERTRDLRAGRTTVVITTSPAWLSRCDHVIFVRPSAVVIGTHRELLADEAYREAVTR